MEGVNIHADEPLNPGLGSFGSMRGMAIAFTPFPGGMRLAIL